MQTYFSEILIETQQFSLTKMHLKMLYVKWQPSCFDLNVLNKLIISILAIWSCSVYTIGFFQSLLVSNYKQFFSSKRFFKYFGLIAAIFPEGHLTPYNPKRPLPFDNITWTYFPHCWPFVQGTRAPSQYPKIRLFVRSRKVSKPRDWYFKLSYRFEIWQAHRQHCCRSVCQISEWSDNSKYKSRGFETLRDLTERRLFGYWDREPVVPSGFPSKRSK